MVSNQGAAINLYGLTCCCDCASDRLRCVFRYVVYWLSDNRLIVCDGSIFNLDGVNRQIFDESRVDKYRTRRRIIGEWRQDCA